MKQNCNPNMTQVSQRMSTGRKEGGKVVTMKGAHAHEGTVLILTHLLYDFSEMRTQPFLPNRGTVGNQV